MKAVKLIIGRRTRCYFCGEEVTLVCIPAAFEGWAPAEPFDSSNGLDVIQIHDCPKHPSKAAA